MSLNPIRLGAKLVNRTRVTNSITPAAVANAIFSTTHAAVGSSRPAAFADHTYDQSSGGFDTYAGWTGTAVADNKGVRPASDDKVVSPSGANDSYSQGGAQSGTDRKMALAQSGLTWDDYFNHSKGRPWSSGVKKRFDGSLASRTAHQAPVHAFTAQRFLSTSSIRKSDTTQIPDFSKYKLQQGHNESTRAFTYLMVGSTGVITAVSGKAFVHDLLSNMSASADVMAMAKIEVDLNKLPEGKNLIVKWRGKPIFIRHRTADEIAEANDVNLAELRDKETDADRVKDPSFLIMVGVCTHLGCVPIGEAGEFGGWFCPCHGSHYDISGRIRKGPAPLNLEVPQYNITADKTVVIG